MPTAVLEIVDLGNGEIVLRRSGDDRDPLVRIQFSEETRDYLMDNSLEVARAMFQSGLQAAAVLLDQEDDAAAQRPRILH